MVKLRMAKVNDIPGIQKVGQASREAAFVTTGIMTPEENEETLVDSWSVEMLTISMTNPSNYAIVATEDDQIVGYLSGRYKNPLEQGQVRLYRIYLHPDHWGKGVGCKMWQSYFAALSPEVKRVDVGSLSDNDRATNFYQRLGFSVVSTETGKHQLQLML